MSWINVTLPMLALTGQRVRSQKQVGLGIGLGFWEKKGQNSNDFVQGEGTSFINKKRYYPTVRCYPFFFCFQSTFILSLIDRSIDLTYYFLVLCFIYFVRSFLIVCMNLARVRQIIPAWILLPSQLYSLLLPFADPPFFFKKRIYFLIIAFNADKRVYGNKMINQSKFFYNYILFFIQTITYLVLGRLLLVDRKKKGYFVSSELLKICPDKYYKNYCICKITQVME